MKRLFLLVTLLSIPPVFAMEEVTERVEVIVDDPEIIFLDGKQMMCNVEGCNRYATRVYVYNAAEGEVFGRCDCHK